MINIGNFYEANNEMLRINLWVAWHTLGNGVKWRRLRTPSRDEPTARAPTKNPTLGTGSDCAHRNPAVRTAAGPRSRPSEVQRDPGAATVFDCRVEQKYKTTGICF